MGEPLESGVDRRALLRGAALGGSLLWAAPVVQAVAGPAYASGTPAPSLSYVAVLLKTSTGTHYRLKYGFPGGAVIQVEQGPTFVTGDCSDTRGGVGGAGFYQNGQGLPAGSLLSTPVPSTVVTHYDLVATDGGFYFVLAPGVTMVDWVVHKGMCCAYKKAGVSPTKLCQPSVGGTYFVSFTQYVSDGARSGNQWLFPAAPNNSTCTKIGNQTYTGACVQPVGVPK